MTAVIKADFKLKKIRVLELVNGEFVVIGCSETKWKVCCNCMHFGSCIFKGKNRVGFIPNLINDYKKFKIKFLMELKNFNKSKQKLS